MEISDFNKTPILPPGTKIVMHYKSDQQATWVYHGLEGFYVTPTPNHVF